MKNAIVTQLNQSEEQQFFTDLLCTGYFIKGVISMDELSEFIAEKSKEHPDCILLSTLDDINQAFYTSGHTIDMHGLDETEGYDLSSLDACVFEDGEHVGYLSTPSEFFIRKRNFLNKTGQVKFNEMRNVFGAEHWHDGINTDGSIRDFFSINERPDTILDATIIVQVVPVKFAYEAISAFPNGYFSCDHTPFENFALAKYLEENHGYKLFGIGASYIGFMRKDSLSVGLAKLLAKDLANYYAEPNNIDMINHIYACIVGKKILIIRYTE